MLNHTEVQYFSNNDPGPWLLMMSFDGLIIQILQSLFPIKVGKFNTGRERLIRTRLIRSST